MAAAGGRAQTKPRGMILQNEGDTWDPRMEPPATREARVTGRWRGLQKSKDMGRLSRMQKSETGGKVGEGSNRKDRCEMCHSDVSAFSQELPEETSSVWEGIGS